MKKIAWIGTGIMGSPMAHHLLAEGYSLSITNRTKEKAESLVNAGALWKDEIADTVVDADIIFTMVGTPQDLVYIYQGEQGILSWAKKGAICIDMTTSSPDLAQQLYQKGLEKQIYILDAPVSGGEIGAKEGTLLIMVGGEKAIFDQVRDILYILGKNLFYMGKAGSGQHTKMANQIAVAGALAACSEVVVYAQKVGLNPTDVIQAISFGSGESYHLKMTSRKMISQNMQPGFYIRHFIKDMKLVQEQATLHQFELPILLEVLKMYEQLSQRGMGELGTQALIQHYQQSD